MDLQLHLPDSELASIEVLGADQLLRFSAACTTRAPQEGVRHAVMGFSRGVTLQLRDVRVIEEQPPQVGRIVAARLQAGPTQLRSIPLPLTLEVPVHLDLDFGHRGRWVASAAGLTARFEGEPHFTESLAC